MKMLRLFDQENCFLGAQSDENAVKNVYDTPQQMQEWLNNVCVPFLENFQSIDRLEENRCQQQLGESND